MQKSKVKSQNNRLRLKKAASLATATFLFFALLIPAISYAQTTQTLTNGGSNIDPTGSGFKLVVCGGPKLPPDLLAKEPNGGANYIPCDFNGLMRTVQHLINILMVLGVFVAVGLFSYAGGLMITGNPKHMETAKGIFPKVGLGFIIMLSAWFIVYQLLDWLTSNVGFRTLLGNP